MNHPLRCRCGRLRGYVTPASSSRRAVCYCRDCRACARHLGRADVLDAHGGTDVVAMHPREVHFDDTTTLACLSLRKGGLLRWYAACCNTPIANTPRDPRIAYAGVVHSCLTPGPPTIDESFGAATVKVNVKSALGEVKESKLAAIGAIVAIGGALLRARLTGSWRNTPFFRDGTPVCERSVLTESERDAAYRESPQAPA